MSIIRIGPFELRREEIHQYFGTSAHNQWLPSPLHHGHLYVSNGSYHREEKSANEILLPATVFNLPSKTNGVTGAMLLAPVSVSALRPPLMTHFSMPGSGLSRAESAVAHLTLAQPDTTRTAAIP